VRWEENENSRLVVITGEKKGKSERLTTSFPMVSTIVVVVVPVQAPTALVPFRCLARIRRVNALQRSKCAQHTPEKSAPFQADKDSRNKSALTPPIWA
jgi:hypothetical protein